MSCFHWFNTISKHLANVANYVISNYILGLQYCTNVWANFMSTKGANIYKITYIVSTKCRYFFLEYLYNIYISKEYLEGHESKDLIHYTSTTCIST